MDMLERKVHALSCSPVFTPQPRREEKGVSVGVQADLHHRKQQENHNDEGKSYHNKLEEEVTHLTNTNTNLSSLNALLSSDLYRSQNDIQNLQDEICLLHEEKFSLERWHGSYDEQRVQIELQTDLIRRLGVLLGRREEQLDSERRMMKLYRDRINRLEDEVEMLRTEWERVLPLVIPRDKRPVLTSTVEIDKDK
jgi:chromosome segregation ATPase